MHRVISMPVAIIAALVMLAGFDSNARPERASAAPKSTVRLVLLLRVRYRQAIYRDPYFLSGIVNGVSLESTTKTANRLAGSLSLAVSLIL